MRNAGFISLLKVHFALLIRDENMLMEEHPYVLCFIQVILSLKCVKIFYF